MCAQRINFIPHLFAPLSLPLILVEIIREGSMDKKNY